MANSGSQHCLFALLDVRIRIERRDMPSCPVPGPVTVNRLRTSHRSHHAHRGPRTEPTEMANPSRNVLSESGSRGTAFDR